MNVTKKKNEQSITHDANKNIMKNRSKEKKTQERKNEYIIIHIYD